MDPEKLQKELLETLEQIKTQAEHIRISARSIGVDPEALRDMHGNWLMAPLLGARALILHALVILETEGDLQDGTERKEGADGANG